MCLTIKNKTSRRVAKHDIHVYKCLDKTKEGEYLTPFMNFPIAFGADGICTLESELIMNFASYISVGIHGYVDPAAALNTELDFRDNDSTMVYHAIIPKGAKYYLGSDGDIAADKMLIFQTTPVYRGYTNKHEIYRM
jgi:hypothetical protein